MRTRETIKSTEDSWDCNLFGEEKIHKHQMNTSPTLTLQDHGVSALMGINDEDLNVALDALASLPSPEAERVLAKPHINPFNGWIPLSTTKLLIELRTTYPYAFQQGRHRGHLAGLALIIFSNTAQVFSDSRQHQLDEWSKSFSGPKLRWETIGLLFSSWAFGALQNKEDIDQYRPRVLASKFFDIMKSCIKFSQAVKANNVLLLYLVYRASIISSILYGPNSKDTQMLSYYV